MIVKKFDLDIYPMEQLQRAAKEYSSLANVKIFRAGTFANCLFMQCKYDQQLTVDEFCNYVIDLIGSRGCKDANL